MHSRILRVFVNNLLEFERKVLCFPGVEMKNYFLILSVLISWFTLINGDDISVPEIVPTYSIGRIYLDDASPLQSGPIAQSEFRLPSSSHGLLNALLRETTLEQLYRRPVFVVTKSSSNPNHLDVAFASSGIQTVLTDPSFGYIRSFLQSRDPKSAVIFDFSSFFNARLLNHEVERFVFPSDFHFADFTKLVTASRLIPVVAVFRRPDFEELRFDHIYQLGNLAVHQEFIEPVVTTEASFINPLSVGPSSVNPALSNPSPVNPAPTNNLPMNPSNVNPTPMNNLPMDPSNVDTAPMNPSNFNLPPTEAMDPSHVNGSPMDQSILNPSNVNSSPMDPSLVNPPH
ncbi:uncharacterized protein LOC120352449 [Nilaparvata lugens]|uniref:uncharacterized protein LOC120352449 n=1 Tax=Nilaparvata lugens TaxID=108931 RepID=UPI00193CB2CF|nr:uncharacterized protein LOC120352449 [Nilaparvata lugens]